MFFIGGVDKQADKVGKSSLQDHVRSGLRMLGVLQPRTSEEQNRGQGNWIRGLRQFSFPVSTCKGSIVNPWRPLEPPGTAWKPPHMHG